MPPGLRKANEHCKHHVQEYIVDDELVEVQGLQHSGSTFWTLLLFLLLLLLLLCLLSSSAACLGADQQSFYLRHLFCAADHARCCSHPEEPSHGREAEMSGDM